MESLPQWHDTKLESKARRLHLQRGIERRTLERRIDQYYEWLNRLISINNGYSTASRMYRN